jgi:clan AA aspartic protease
LRWEPFRVALQIGGLAGQCFVPVEALVDTGSRDTSVPEDVLKGLRIVPDGERQYSLADERIITYPIGEAPVRLQGRERTVPVVFLPRGTSPMLGATTLGIFGLGVDPSRKQLIPVPGLMK